MVKNMKFSELGLSSEITKVIEEEGYIEPSLIQEAIPFILSGEDLIGTALTGTGKTAAFCLATFRKT